MSTWDDVDYRALVENLRFAYGWEGGRPTYSAEIVGKELGIIMKIGNRKESAEYTRDRNQKDFFEMTGT